MLLHIILIFLHKIKKYLEQPLTFLYIFCNSLKLLGLSMNKNIENLGQVFTQDKNILEMINLIRNKKGVCLEPSCGNGAILKILDKKKTEYPMKEIHAFEIDEDLKSYDYVKYGDFFTLIKNNEYKNKCFDTIIGNPPYVKYKNINLETKKNLDVLDFDERSNLYLFFIKKSVELLNKNGELIFLVPRDFLKATSAIRMNNWLFSQGTITDIIDYGDEVLFNGFNPNCIIFRFEKGNFKRTIKIKKYKMGKTKTSKLKLSCINGQFIFSKEELVVDAKQLFTVKVGAVSGADKIFENKKGNLEMVCSETYKNGKLRKMFYNIYSEELETYKSVLLSRKIKSFNENNWFTWGRGYFKTEKNRIYVNAKTRNKNPFFLNDCKAYDGSILALFPKKDLSKTELEELKNLLNNLDWESLGFLCGNRYLFSQKSLANLKLPKSFEKFL